MIHVDVIKNSSTGLRQEMRAHVTTTDRDEEIFFRWRGAACASPGDVFLLATLPLALEQAQGLRLNEPISVSLLDGLPALQTSLQALIPTLSSIEIEATGVEPFPESAHPRTGVLFDGGVASLFCLTRHFAEIDALVVVADETDAQSPQSPTRRRGPAFSRHTAVDLAKETAVVETNAGRLYQQPGFSSRLGRGFVRLAGGSALAGQLGRLHLPHDLLGPNGETNGQLAGLNPGGLVLFANGERAREPEMFAAILGHEKVAGTLRVCWENPGRNFNCGRCPACTRRIPVERLLRSLDGRTETDLDGVKDDQNV